jgi:molecular chaperone GrpE
MSLIDSNLELNTIVSVIQKGYKIGDRLVRPALVSVSNGKKTSNKED